MCSPILRAGSCYSPTEEGLGIGPPNGLLGTHTEETRETIPGQCVPGVTDVVG